MWSFLHMLLILIGFAAASPTYSPPPSYNPQPPPLISNVTIFQPPANYTVPRTLYARTLQLPDGTFLATWENYGPNNNTFPHFPIYASSDNGATWSERSKVYDTQNGWGLRYQPFLYTLPCQIGDYPAGTILLSGSSIPDDLSQTLIEIYASKDLGYTWEFVSHVALGGRAIPNNGETPVWEPFLLFYPPTKELVVYYSDQRDPQFGQKLVHQTTTDLLTYGPVINDVAYTANYTWRPGMTTISHLPNDQYLLTYEFYGAVEADFAVYYRLSDDPLTFDDKEGHVIIGNNGTVAKSSPYNVWTSAGGKNGTIVVSCGDYEQLFVNHDLAEPGSVWEEVGSNGEGKSYTRSLLVEKYTDHERVLVVGGGVLNGEMNRVSGSEIDVGVL